MKPLFVVSGILLITCAALPDFYHADRFPTENSVRQMSSVSSSFTDMTQYNTWDHAGIPLGLFEKQHAITTLHLGYRRLRWKNTANFDSTRVFNGIIMPSIRVGAPGKIFLDLNYSINPTSITDEDETPSMPLNRFGLTLIGQVEDGRFQIGITGKGYIGKETWGANSNERILMGGDDVGLFLGFKLHDAVLLNVYGSSSGYIDTLYMDNEDFPQERFSWFQLPHITVAMDIGMDNVPYRSNMSVTYSHNNFVYTGKVNDNIDIFEPYYNVLSERNIGGDTDPIVSDSIAWHMQHLWNIEVSDIVRFDPAAHLGYWHSRYKHMEPNGDNYPINYNGERPGWEWDTKSFRFGLGGSWWFEKAVKIWLEYSYASLNLALTGDNLSAFRDEVPATSGYSRFGAGFTTHFDQIPRLGMPQSSGLYFTFGFLFMQDNDLTAPYGSLPFYRMYPLFDDRIADLNVALNRYQPWEVIKNKLVTTHFGIGIGVSFLDTMFDTGLHFGICNQRYTAGREEEYKGFEFGFDLIYNKFGDARSGSED